MYCVTEERNDEYWASLPQDQGGPYDCCIEILDFVEFSKRLIAALQEEHSFRGDVCVDKCFYEANEGVIADGTTKHLSYFRKPVAEDYQAQKEVRAVMVPTPPSSIEPRTVYVDAVDLIRFIE